MKALTNQKSSTRMPYLNQCGLVSDQNGLFPCDIPVCNHRYIEAFVGNSVVTTLYVTHASYTCMPSKIKDYPMSGGKAASRAFFDVFSGT